MTRLMSSCALIVVLLIAFAVQNAQAAQLAEEQTVLYYLVEMQRQHGAPCPGGAKQPLPSLTPSESLRSLALEASSGQGNFESLVASSGLQGAPVFYSSVGGATPKDAVANLQAQQCLSVMNPQYTYIGAAKSHGGWTIIMTGKEPTRAVYTPQPQAFAPSQEALQPLVVREGVTPLADPNPMPMQMEAPPAVMQNDVAQGAAGATGAVPRQGRIVSIDPQPTAAPTGFAGDDGDPAAPAPPQVVGVITYTNGPVAKLEGQQGAAAAPVAPAGARTPYAAPIITNPAETAIEVAPDVAEPVAVGGADASDAASRLIAQVNAVRSRGYVCGGVKMKANPAKENRIISAVAKRHATDMGVRGFFSSTSPEGERAGKRLSSAGYTWALVAENIASGPNAPEMIVESWLASESQCKSIMNAEFTEVGAGWDGTHGLWVLMLASPMPSGAIRLN